VAKKNKSTDVFQHIDMRGGDKTQCWPWKKPLNGAGRPYFDLDGKKTLAYRITYELIMNDPLGDRMARHTCDNESCCNPYHIIPGTNQDNMNDMKERERHGLPHHTVKAIKRLLAKRVEVVNGQELLLTQQVIADRFGISRELVSCIKTGRVYDHVKLETEDSE
jgi:hypothetical protein